jgi:uncharacterized membrane protein
MKSFISILSCIFLFSFVIRVQTFAQQPNTPSQEFYKAEIIKVEREGVVIIGGTKTPYQVVLVQLLEGRDKGKVATIRYGDATTISQAQKVAIGEKVILQKTTDTKSPYIIYDKYRLTNIMYAAIAFFFLVLLVAGWKGLGSIVGLIISIAVILLYMLPQILAGANPLVSSIITSIAILLVTTYLAHGISRQTTVALFSTFLSLMITVAIASFFVSGTLLSGMNGETSTLLFGPTSKINFQGLLLAGIIIGTLGALNDITTTQAATIFELAKHDPKAKFEKLFLAGFRVGREHIVSMVNTLVLAYAGSALALLLFFVLNPQKIPYWVIVNNEDISDEIVRTLAGSMGLILVVPIVTIFAALMCDKKVQAYFSTLFQKEKK